MKNLKKEDKGTRSYDEVVQEVISNTQGLKNTMKKPAFNIAENISIEYRRARLKNLTENAFSGINPLKEDKARCENNLFLLKQMDVYQKDQKDNRAVRTVFLATMGILLTVFTYLIINK